MHNFSRNLRLKQYYYMVEMAGFAPASANLTLMMSTDLVYF